MSKIADMLIRHEGLKGKPYKDSVGKLTIGVGRNLDDVGLTYWECLYLLDNDIRSALKELIKYPWFDSLDSVRQDALTDMMFNLGGPRFSKFKKMIAAFAAKDYIGAAKEMRTSTWASQVGSRADELAMMIETGEYKKLV